MKKRCFIWILVLTFAGCQAGSEVFREQEYRLRQTVSAWVKGAFPRAYLKAAARYGLKPFESAVPGSRGKKKHYVVLVHGLDDPGLVWMTLAPALDRAGYAVLIFTYPNDQACAVSARFLAQSLSPYARAPYQAFSIIGHSMGGLVARQMLTDPDIAYGDLAGCEHMPRVSNLIMVGTPNHGAPLARVRVLMEIRDQIHQVFFQNAPWLQCIADGAGEAGLDLLPGSPFLVRLNSRPHPGGLNIHIIAATLFPWSGKYRVGRLIGDGLVPLDSARLKSVPLTLVRGTHLTMIRNLSRSSTRVPPAVPVIMELLGAN